MTRQFVCPETGELCSRPDCKVGHCVEANKMIERRAADADRPAWRGSIRIGRRYRLRNGSIVSITGRQTLRTKREGLPDYKADVWVGNFLRTATKITWQIDGWHAPTCGVRPHELDIVSTAP
jgi:hypothetical protein